ncbi:MAG: response regulator [Patescibacteria group bacterium]
MPDQKVILLVEDDSLISRMYQEKFLRDGFEVILAFNGEQGLEQAALKPDIILLDIMMPKMNGYEMLKLLKKKRGLASIPVIILSSIGGDMELIEKAKKLGVADTIVKGDVSPKQVVERVRKVLEGK